MEIKKEAAIEIGEETIRIPPETLASIMCAAVRQFDRDIDNSEAKDGDAYIAFCKERRDIAEEIADKLIKYKR